MVQDLQEQLQQAQEAEQRFLVIQEAIQHVFQPLHHEQQHPQGGEQQKLENHHHEQQFSQQQEQQKLEHQHQDQEAGHNHRRHEEEDKSNHPSDKKNTSDDADDTEELSCHDDASRGGLGGGTGSNENGGHEGDHNDTLCDEIRRTDDRAEEGEGGHNAPGGSPGDDDQAGDDRARDGDGQGDYVGGGDNVGGGDDVADDVAVRYEDVDEGGDMHGDVMRHDDDNGTMTRSALLNEVEVEEREVMVKCASSLNELIHDEIHSKFVELESFIVSCCERDTRIVIDHHRGVQEEVRNIIEQATQTEERLAFIQGSILNVMESPHMATPPSPPPTQTKRNSGTEVTDEGSAGSATAELQLNQHHE